MIVDINEMLINIDNLCSVKRCCQTNNIPGDLEYCLHLKFMNGSSEMVVFKNEDAMNIGYQTIRLFETVTKRTSKK